jgi:hypothetical protein
MESYEQRQKETLCNIPDGNDLIKIWINSARCSARICVTWGSFPGMTNTHNSGFVHHTRSTTETIHKRIAGNIAIVYFNCRSHAVQQNAFRLLFVAWNVQSLPSKWPTEDFLQKKFCTEWIFFSWILYRLRHKSVNANGLSYAPGSQYIVVGGKAARNAWHGCHGRHLGSNFGIKGC